MGTITCEPKALAEALAAVKPAVNTSSAIQALSGARINKCANTFYVSASDMSVYALRELNAGGDQLDVVVPHKLLTEAVKLLAKRDTLTLTHDADAGEVHVSNGNRTIKLRTLRVEDFPATPAQGGRVLLIANGSELASVIARAARFRSRDETRPILTGMHLSWGGEPMTLVATDSYRLAALRVPGEQVVQPGKQPEENSVTVDGRGLEIAGKAMAKPDGPVSILANEKWTTVEIPGMTFCLRNVDGQYPNYRQLFPDKFNDTLTVPVADMLEATSVARKFCLKNVPARLWVNGHVKLHGYTPDVGGFEEILSNATVEPATKAMVRERMGDKAAESVAPPEEFEIGLNPEFLDDVLKSHAGEIATVQLLTPLRPATFEDGDDRFILMPIRLNV